jgi:hypothetical protein
MEGGQKVHDLIVSAFDKVTGKQSAQGMGTAGFTGGNNLPGIWGSSFFTNYQRGTTSGPRTTSQGISVPSTYTPAGQSTQTPNFWGKMGAYSSIGAGTALTAASGFQQMKGGGAKNIVGGLGTVGMAIGSGAMAAAAAGATAFAAGGSLALLGPIGMVLGAVLIIASMFMKGAKSTQSQSQTSETKVGSKIDVSNKRLELINRNLLALRNTMETFALSSSAYLSEKNGTIDGNFALAGKRSY